MEGIVDFIIVFWIPFNRNSLIFICFCLLLAAISNHYTRQLPHVMQQGKIFYDPAAVYLSVAGFGI